MAERELSGRWREGAEKASGTGAAHPTLYGPLLSTAATSFLRTYDTLEMEQNSENILSIIWQEEVFHADVLMVVAKVLTTATFFIHPTISLLFSAINSQRKSCEK